MDTVIVDGYGVCFENIQFQDMPTLIKFIDHHCARLYKEKLHTFIDKKPKDYADFEDFFRRIENFKGCAPAEILMDAIYHDYRIWLNVIEGTDGKLYVLFIPAYPWEYNHEDKKLTENGLSEIFKNSLTDMLGYPPEESCLRYYNVECRREDSM